MPTTPPSPGLRERKKARTRASIQREALRLFIRDGYAATSIEQIAAAAEVSASTFFRYFPTKEDVVLADFIDVETMRLFAEAPPELDLVGALIHAIREGLGRMSEEDIDLERARNALIRSEPELRRGQLAEITRPVDLLAEGVARRTGRPDGDVDARLFAGAVIGAIALAGYDDDAAVEEMVETATSRLERVRAIVTLPPA